MKILLAFLVLTLASASFAQTLNCKAAIYDSAKNTKDYFDLIDELGVDDLSEAGITFEPTPVLSRTIKKQIEDDGKLWSDAISLSGEGIDYAYNFTVSVEKNLITNVSIENEMRHTGTNISNKTGTKSIEASSSDFDSYFDVSCTIE